jgi:hypothetical protein
MKSEFERLDFMDNQLLVDGSFFAVVSGVVITAYKFFSGPKPRHDNKDGRAHDEAIARAHAAKAKFLAENLKH